MRSAEGIRASRGGESVSCSRIHFGAANATPTVSSVNRPSKPAPHHRENGGFRNPWPNAQLHGLKDFLRWRFGGGRDKNIAPTPPVESFPSRRPSVVYPRASAGYRSVTWVGHSTVLLQLGPLNVLTDPMWSDRASPVQWAGPHRLMPPGIDFDALPEIDLVLQSHNHYDHLDERTTKRLVERFPQASWLCPLRLGRLLRSWGVRHLVERDWWQTVETPMFTATCTPAQHFSSRGLGDRDETLWCGWTLAADNVRVLFAGDTGLHPEFGAIADRAGPFDLVMLPIGAYEPRWFMGTVHMNPEDAVAAYRELIANASATPPCLGLHWGTFRLTDEPMQEPPERFARLWAAAGLPAGANWTFAHGETRRFGTSAQP
jgi:N-acyl-phosphatidylethanolamine-hydrolysing phospholipase D